MRRDLRALTTLLLLTLMSCTQKEITYSSAESLRNATVAVAIGASHDAFMTKNYPEANIIRPEAMAELAVLVSEGRADYAILDRNVADAMIALNDNLIIVDNEVMYTDIAAGFNKSGGIELCKEFNLFMSDFTKSDTFADIQARWNIGGGEIPTIETPTQGERIKVGVCELTPPFCQIINNELQGSSIEIIKHFAQNRGYVLDLMPMNFSALLTSLQSNKIDILISGLTRTEERAKSILFSDIYQKSPSVVIARKSKSQIAAQQEEEEEEFSLDLLQRSRVAVLLGSTGDNYMNVTYPDTEIVRIENIGDFYPMLKNNYADYMLLDLPIIQHLQSEVQDIDILEEDLFSIGVAAAFPKQATALQAEFNEFLSRFIPTETYQELFDRWYVRGDIVDIPKVESVKSGKRLTVATETTSFPSSAIINNVLTGFEIELIRHFALDRGYQIEFMQTSFVSVISALATQKADIGVCSICVTEERKKSLLFSDEYHSVAVAIAQISESSPVDGAEKLGVFGSIKRSFINNIMTEQRYKLIYSGIVVTLIISILSMILGTFVGAGVCMLTMSESRIYRFLGNTYVTIMRGTPVLVILMINFYVIFAKVSISPVLVATISFALNFGAYVSEMFRASIMSIDRGQSEAGWAMGFTKIQTFIFFIAPQAIKQVLPVYKGEAISLIKMTSIVGYIAVQDITKVGDIIRSRTFDAFFPLLVSALLYFLIAYLFSIAIDLLTANITRRK